MLPFSCPVGLERRGRARAALSRRLRDAGAQRSPSRPPRSGDAQMRAAGGGYVTTLRSTMSPAARGGWEAAAGPTGNLSATRRRARCCQPRLPLRPASAARLRLPGTQLRAAARYGVPFFVLLTFQAVWGFWWGFLLVFFPWS